MVKIEEVLKELEKLDYNEKINYLNGLLKIIKEKDILKKINELLEKIKKEKPREEEEEIRENIISKAHFEDAPEIKYETRVERIPRRESNLERIAAESPKVEEPQVVYETNYESIVRRDQLEDNIRDYLSNLNINPLVDRNAARQAITRRMEKIGRSEREIDLMVNNIVDPQKYSTEQGLKSTNVVDIIKDDENRRKTNVRKYIVKGY